MRIISGTYKGRYIPVRKNFQARPTTDFAKENIFNVMSNHFDFEQLTVLDLFSGTGSISYEFASRGCKEIVSVEKDFRSFDFIKKTAKELQLSSITAMKADTFLFLKKSHKNFDIIFADPPYDLDRIHEIPERVFASALLKTNGWLILEHGKSTQFNDHEYLIDCRKYGSVHFSIFEKK